MHPNSYMIPGARGILRVSADNSAVSAQVAAAVADFKSQFEAWKTTHGDKVTEVAANLLEIEQKLADRLGTARMGGSTRHDPAAALAQHLTKNADFQAVLGQKSTRTKIEIDAGMLLNVEASTIKHDDGFFDTKDLHPGIVGGVERRVWLRNRFTPLKTTGSTAEYHRELTYDNQAAPQGAGSPFVHEGTEKQESAITYEAKEEKIPTIAHFIKASKQIMSDVNGLRMTLGNRLLYGLELKTEQQIIAGTGVGAQMSGLTKAGNFTAFTPQSGETALDSLSRAISAIQAADGECDLIVLHPNDLGALRRLKASGSGEFLFGQPAGGNRPSAWDVDFHVTPSMTEGSFIAMDVQQAAVIFERMNATVDVGWVSDDFTRNLMTLLAEVRLTIACQRPTMIRFGSLVL